MEFIKIIFIKKITVQTKLINHINPANPIYHSSDNLFNPFNQRFSNEINHFEGLRPLEEFHL